MFTGHTGSIKTVAVSPNGRIMASAGEDKSIILWDLGSGKRIKKMTGHTGFIYSLSFSADNNVLVSGGADSTVRVWDVNTDETSATSTTFMDTEDIHEPKRFKLEQDRKRKSVLERLVFILVFTGFFFLNFFLLIVVNNLPYSLLNKHLFMISNLPIVTYVL